MEEVSNQFNRCWKTFKNWYNLQKREGFHNIWNLSDFKFHLARICLDNFEGKTLHLDVHDVIPWKRVSMIICEPAGIEQILGSEGQNSKIDLVVDIIYGDSFPKSSNRSDHELFVLRKTLEFFNLEIRKKRILTGTIITLNCTLNHNKDEVSTLLKRYSNINVLKFRTQKS